MSSVDFKSEQERMGLSELDLVKQFSLSKYNVEIPLRHGKLLLFNSRTEQIALLSPAEVAAYEAFRGNGDLIERDLENYKLFRAAGFIVNQSFDESTALGERFDTSRTNKAALTVTVAATLQCNLACGYCFQGLNKPKGKMSEEVKVALTEYVSSRQSELSNLTIVWYGGEPLMDQRSLWELSTELRRTCSQADIGYSGFIVTNGYLLTGKMARKLVDHGVTGAQVTIDGMADAHNKNRPHVSGRGSFDQIEKNLREVLEESTLSVAIRLSVDQGNVENLSELLVYFADSGFSEYKRFSVYFAPIEAISEKCSDYESQTLSKLEYAQNEIQLFKKAEALALLSARPFGQNRGMCQAVRSDDFVLTPTGDLHKCWDTVTMDEMSVTSILDPNFDKAIQNNEWTKWKPANDVCGQCKIAPICGGGCAFKTVHADQQSGLAAALPCIPLKFNAAEHIFIRAKLAGIVTDADWDPKNSPTAIDGVLKTGPSHTLETRASFQGIMESAEI